MGKEPLFLNNAKYWIIFAVLREEAGSWKLEAGSWKLEGGGWKLEGVSSFEPSASSFYWPRSSMDRIGVS
jgi:hypothetical protein